MLTVRSGLIASSLAMLTEISRRMIGIVSLIILARILSPEDYGLVAIAMLFINFISVISDTGGRGYLMSRGEISDELVMTNWTINFLLRGLLATCLAIASIPIAHYYDDSRLIPIILVCSFQIVLGTLSSPGMVYKYKNQELGAITTWNIISRFVTTGITIAIAIIYETYWALVIGQVLVTFSGFLASYTIAPMLPKFCLTGFRSQLNFSKWILLQSIVSYFRSQIDAIFVSAAFPKAIMGAYNSMRYYAMIPATMVVSPAVSQLLTQFSQFKDNKTYLQKQIQVVLVTLSIVCAPVVYVMVTHEVFLVGFVLGEKWVEYSSLLAIFSLQTLIMSFNRLLTTIIMLKDKTRLLFVYSVVSTLLQCFLFFSVDFESIYQLGVYKISLDLIAAAAFFMLVVWTMLGKSAFSPLLLPMIPAGVFIYVMHLGVSSVLPPVTNFGTFVLQVSAVGSGFLLANYALMWLLKDRVHCYGYLYKLILKFFRLCWEKLPLRPKA